MLGTLRLSPRGSANSMLPSALLSVSVCYVSALWTRGGFQDQAGRALLDLPWFYRLYGGLTMCHRTMRARSRPESLDSD